MKKLFSTLFLALLLLVGFSDAQIPWVYPLYPFMDTVVFDEDLQIRELSAAPSQVSGYGKLYVLASNGSLYYKDDAGSVTDLTDVAVASHAMSTHSDEDTYNILTSGTLGAGGPWTMTQNSDTVVFSHDGTDAKILSSSESLLLESTGGSAEIELTGDLLPATDAAYDIGGTNAWEDLIQTVTGAHYFGPIATDNTYKIVRDGTKLSFLRRESGAYVEVGNFDTSFHTPRLHVDTVGGVAGSLCYHGGTSPPADPDGYRIWVDGSGQLQVLEPNADPGSLSSSKVGKDADFIKKDGSVALTSDWDIGDIRIDFNGAKVRTQRYVDTGTNTNLGEQSFGAGNLVAGGYNNAFGRWSLYNITDGTGNNAFGNEALLAVTKGLNNVGIASFAGKLITEGDHNINVGYKSGYAITVSDNNISIGSYANYEGTGSKNITIGYNIDLPVDAGNNQLNIGNLIYGTGLDGDDKVISTGKVGIGLTNPAEKLDVAGNVKISGNLTDGTNSLTIANAKSAYNHGQAAHAPSSAEQNVQSNWNASSGDSYIQNKPTIPDFGGTISPDNDITYDLGTPTKRYRDVHTQVVRFPNSTGDQQTSGNSEPGDMWLYNDTLYFRKSSTQVQYINHFEKNIRYNSTSLAFPTSGYTNFGDSPSWNGVDYLDLRFDGSTKRFEYRITHSGYLAAFTINCTRYADGVNNRRLHWTGARTINTWYTMTDNSIYDALLNEGDMIKCYIQAGTGSFQGAVQLNAYRGAGNAWTVTITQGTYLR